MDSAPGPFSILAIPCGIPRDVSDLVRRRPDLEARIEYLGMDLDAEVLAAAREHLADCAPAMLAKASWLHGNALVDLDFPVQPVDLVISTGLGEFLDDGQLRQFYRNVFVSLSPGGSFFTSATRREGGSDYFLRAFELNTHYRTLEQLRAILSGMPWRDLELYQDGTGLQTFAVATR